MTNEEVRAAIKSICSFYDEDMGIRAGEISGWQLEKILKLIDQVRREAVEGFIKYANVIALNTTNGVVLSALIEAYLESLQSDSSMKGESNAISKD